jgi:hypothetical protein
MFSEKLNSSGQRAVYLAGPPASISAYAPSEDTIKGTVEVTVYSTPIRSGTWFVSPPYATTTGLPRRESRSPVK